MRWRVVQVVTRTAFREFWRSPEAVFWTYCFPLALALVLGFAFRPGELPKVPVAVIDGPGAEAAVDACARSARLAVERLPAAAAERALARGRIALAVRIDAGVPVLRSDPTRPEAELARLLVEAAWRDARDPRPAGFVHETEARPGARYIDFLVPGLIGLNLLGAGLWGIGFNLVNMRSQQLLRRLFVTPMRRAEFLLGFLLGRSLLVLPEALVIVLFGAIAWGVPCRGSLLALLLLVVVGGLAFAGVGCLCAARARTIEGVSGVMNAVMLPMWLLGGTFFATEPLHGIVRWVAEAMPLTHVNRALRTVMLEPAALGDVWLPLVGLAAFGVACFALALRVFRWQ